MATTMESAFTDSPEDPAPQVLHSGGGCESCPPDDGDETGRTSGPTRRRKRKPRRPPGKLRGRRDR